MKLSSFVVSMYVSFLSVYVFMLLFVHGIREGEEGGSSDIKTRSKKDNIPSRSV